VLVAHPVGVGLEVAQGFVSFGGHGAHELQVAGGGQRGGDVPGVKFFQALGEPGGLAVAQQPGGEGGQLVDVLASVVEAGDLGGDGEVLVSEVPDSGRAVAEDDELADVLAAAAARLGVYELAEPGGGLEGGQVGRGARVTDRAAVVIEGGLGE